MYSADASRFIGFFDTSLRLSAWVKAEICLRPCTGLMCRAVVKWVVGGRFGCVCGALATARLARRQLHRPS